MVAPALLRPRVVAFGLLALCGWLVWAGDTPAKMTQDAVPVPDQVGEWTGIPVDVDQRAIEILETDDVALMEYRQGEESPVWFAQVAGFGNRAAFHPPELCYLGSHFEILERERIPLMVNGRPRQVMRLVIGQDNEQFEAWYWFTAGERVTPSYYRQQFWLLADTIRRRRSSGTLVRISTALNPQAPEAAHQRLLGFTSSFDGVNRQGMSHGG